MLNINDGLFLGVDGCRGGWIACVLDHGNLRMERYDSMEALVYVYPEFDAFLIDMVVGLRSSADQLRPDDLARKELGSRSSSIFPIPCRQAVYADTEEAQKQANIRVLGKSLAKQTINIIPKIRELDEFLALHPVYKNRILESHPEVDFARLNGAVVLTRKKEPDGFSERTAILGKYLPDVSFSGMRERAKEFRCNPDDLLDAVCLAVTAALASQGLCETIPAHPEPDDTGLYMRLTIPGKQVGTGSLGHASQENPPGANSVGHLLQEKSTGPDFVGRTPQENQRGLSPTGSQGGRQKVAVVTGGASGIGKCIAEEFRKQGVKVYVIDKADGDHYVGDISDKSVLESFAEKVISENGGIDYLINNALPLMKGIDECSYEKFQYALAVGVAAPFYLGSR